MIRKHSGSLLVVAVLGTGRVWHWGSDQAVVAMQLVTTANGLTCPRLLRRLHATRPDLQHAFRLHDEESLAEFFCCIACTARWNWMLLQNFPRCVWQLQNLQVNDNPGQHAAFRFLASPLHSLIATGMLSGACGDSPGKARLVADWYDKYGRHLLPTPTEVPAPLAAAQRRRRQVAA